MAPPYSSRLFWHLPPTAFFVVVVKQALFFKAVIGSQQNWVGSTESSRIPPAPIMFNCPPLSTSCDREVHLLQLVNPHSVQFSGSVVSNSLWPHGLQHARLPCPSPTPGVHSNSCPSRQWCHPTISSSVVPFSSHVVLSLIFWLNYSASFLHWISSLSYPYSITLYILIWRRKWQPTPVFLPGESHGQRSLVVYTVHSVVKSQIRLSN